MPVLADYLRDEPIVVVNLVGDCTPEEINAFILSELNSYLTAQAPTIVYLIFNISELAWSFGEFVDYLGKTGQRRANAATPLNIAQSFVGNNSWINAFRTWLKKRYGDESASFTNVEEAIAYARTRIKLNSTK